MKKEELNMLLKEEKEFTDRLNKIIMKKFNILSPVLSECLVSSFKMVLATEELHDILKDYIPEGYKNIGARYIFSVSQYEPNKVEWDYKNININPNGYYIRPDKSRFITILETLRECIKQDTHRPNIQGLELDIVEEK